MMLPLLRRRPSIASPNPLLQVRGILEGRGFSVVDEASERKSNPGVLSEVSMVYGVRPGYTLPARGAATAGVRVSSKAARG